MSMTPKFWSINALSVELGRDRRTVAKALAGVPPAGEERGKPVWRLQDAASALAALGRPVRALPDPDAQNPLDAGLGLACRLAGSLFPAALVAVAVERGLMTRADAGPLYEAAQEAARRAVSETAAMTGAQEIIIPDFAEAL